MKGVRKFVPNYQILRSKINYLKKKKIKKEFKLN